MSKNYTTNKLKWSKPLIGNYVMGYDPGAYEGDYGVVLTWKTPSRLRKFLRRIGLDRSTWQYKLHSQEFIK